MKNKLWIFLLLAAFVVLGIAGYIAINYIQESSATEESMETLRLIRNRARNEASHAASDTGMADPASAPPENTPAVQSRQNEQEAQGTSQAPEATHAPFVFDERMIREEYRALYALNNELIGWLTIPDTVIDYPVLQSDTPGFWLAHDYFGEKNANGCLVMEPSCDVYTPSQSLLIHGHDMKNGHMFRALHNYYSKSFGMNHLTIYFDTLIDSRTYEVVAGFYSKVFDENETGFRYYMNITNAETAKYFVDSIKRLRWYDTGIEFDETDEFLVLSTCAENTRNGRCVVIARRVKD